MVKKIQRTWVDITFPQGYPHLSWQLTLLSSLFSYFKMHSYVSCRLVRNNGKNYHLSKWFWTTRAVFVYSWKQIDFAGVIAICLHTHITNWRVLLSTHPGFSLQDKGHSAGLQGPKIEKRAHPLVSTSNDITSYHIISCHVHHYPTNQRVVGLWYVWNHIS